MAEDKLEKIRLGKMILQTQRYQRIGGKWFEK
jgi:hypothetical protein